MRVTPVLLTALVLAAATGVALPSPIAGTHWHRLGPGHPAEPGRPRQHARVPHPRALHSGPSDWYVVVRPQHRRLGPSTAPAQPRVLEPGLLLHSASERVGPWLRVFDSAGKSWVDVGNVRPAHEPRGWDKLVLKIHPILRPRVTVPPPLPVANAAPVISAGAAAATPQPVVVQQQVVVQPLVYGTDPASVEAEVTAAGDAAFGLGQGQYMADVVRYESGFNPYAVNPSSGACTLFQAYPCDKQPCSLSDVPCQIDWGIGYIRSVYGTPQAAWYSEQTRGWY